MRIAISGTHRVGKTTLAQAIADTLPGCDFVDEPYHGLVAEGYVFSHPPSVEDFEAQLEYSLAVLSDGGRHVVFDRCPVDLLAYLAVASHDEGEVMARWWEPVRRAIRLLDAVILVPIESPDRIELDEDDDPTGHREMVDVMLREWLLDDRLELGVDVFTVRGSLRRRAASTLEWLARNSLE